jgi:hypothetical protein
MGTIGLDIDMEVFQRDLDYYLNLSNTYDVRDINKFRKEVIREYREKDQEILKKQQEERLNLEKLNAVSVADGVVAEEVENSSVDTDREGSSLGSEMKDFGDLREDSHDDLKDNESNILDELNEIEKLFRGVTSEVKDIVKDGGMVVTEPVKDVDMVEPETVKDDDAIEPEPAKGDMIKEQVTVHEDNKEYIDHGRYIEDYSDRVVLDDAVPKVVETADFVEHGRYVEDYKNIEEDNSEVVVNDVESKAEETIDFVDHGRYVEDYVKEEETEIKEEPVEVENTEIENENIDDLFNPEELETEINALEAENNEPEVDKENSGIFSFTNEVNQKEKDSDLLDDFWLQMQSDISLKSENTESELENILSEIKEPVVEKVKEPEEHVPEDIRDFIREHKGSEIGYVAKFYSKKVIEKNIAMGRIYKRKGKLFI